MIDRFWALMSIHIYRFSYGWWLMVTNDWWWWWWAYHRPLGGNFFSKQQTKYNMKKLYRNQQSWMYWIPFLFSCPGESLRQLYTYPCNWVTDYKRFYFWTLKNNPRDLWTWDNWSEWWGDMTWPNKLTKTMTKTNTNTFRKHCQRAIIGTCGHCLETFDET